MKNLDNADNRQVSQPLTEINSIQLLTVNEQPLSLQKALTYLRTSGKLSVFITDILGQYVIEQELLSHKDINIDPVLSEQVAVNFRLERQLNNAQVFAQWLVNNGLDYSTFHEQIFSSLKLAALKQKIIEPKLQQYFIERKIFLDRVALSTIVVASKELADELLRQIEEGAVFETLAREYSLTEDPIINGMLGAVSRSSLSDDIRSLVDAASPREIVGPLTIEGKWFLLRVEKFLPASLDNPQLKQALENELFDQWLAEKIQKLTIKVEIK